jgi:hypothetical protein
LSSQLEIRSFRSVFALERRIYRIDTLRLNPSGIPLRGIGYAVALILLALVAGAVPPTSLLDGLIPWYLRDVGMPLGLAALLGALRLEGRPFHVAAGALLGHALGPRRLSMLAPLPRRARRWHPPELLLIPDGSDARFRRLRYRGPGAVLVKHPHLRAEWSAFARADVTLHPVARDGVGACAMDLAAGAVLEVRSR